MGASAKRPLAVASNLARGAACQRTAAKAAVRSEPPLVARRQFARAPLLQPPPPATDPSCA